MVHVGFTGTRKGMTGKQLSRLVSVLMSFPEPFVFHHGCCVGADAEAHEAVGKIMLRECRVLHPPVSKSQEASFTSFSACRGRKDYLERNRDIVDECSVLIAAPETEKEVRRSGTWATVRYARKTGKQVVVLEP